ncbi:MAG TPA: hypothetical protein VFR03_12400 [Thermoanaerobaculia bacterium]|nr:hypothetical protein [Thermoanaerobaculia bacterium]
MRAWYGGIFGGLLPILLLGFLYSAIADRTVFALWALVAGAFWVAALRQGLAAGWGRFRLLAALFLVLAIGLAAFAGLEWEHHEILDLGFRAVFPGLYRPLLTEPGAVAVLAGAFALAGLVFLPLGRRRHQ